MNSYQKPEAEWISLSPAASVTIEMGDTSNPFDADEANE